MFGAAPGHAGNQGRTAACAGDELMYVCHVRGLGLPTADALYIPGKCLVSQQPPAHMKVIAAHESE